MPIEYTVFDNGFTEVITGKVHSVDQIKKQIKVTLDDGSVDYVLFSEIINVQVKD